MALLSSALFSETGPGFFRVLSSPAARLYIDALNALEQATAERPLGIDREEALALVEQAVETHHDVQLEEDATNPGTPTPPTLGSREKARLVLETLRRAGWLEEEEKADWQKLIHFHPNGQTLLLTLRKLAFPEGVVFSDKLVGVCTTLTRQDGPHDPLREEPWAHVESCVSALQAGIAELRGIQGAIERHTRRQLGAATLKENLSVLFDQFAERIGNACYSELVRARLPLRLGQARRRVDELQSDPELLDKMQAELMRREPAMTPAQTMSKVRLRLEELSDLLQSVVPVADAVDRRTAEFTRRSLARFRYLQETTSETRSQVQEFFENINRQFAGQRMAQVEDGTLEFPKLRIHDTRLFAGLESLFQPRLRKTAGEIAPLEDEAGPGQQEDALRRLHAAMRDSMTVARANRFVEDLLPERGGSLPSNSIPIRCEEDLADLIACLLHANAASATFKVEVDRETTGTEKAQYDQKLSYRIERFTLHRK